MRSMSRLLGHRPVVSFVVLAYVFSWCAYAPAVIAYAQTASMPPAFLLLSVIGNFGPLVAAVVLTYLIGGRAALSDLAARLRRWRVAWPWYAVAFSWEAVHLLATTGVARLITGRFPIFPDNYPLVAAPVIFSVIFITAGLAEEVGWRGFALPRLQARWSPLLASCILGLVWALWHLPGTFLPDTAHTGRNAAEWLWYIAGTIAFTVFITWVFNGTRGSVLLTMLLHAASNTTQAYLPSDIMIAGINVDVVTHWVLVGIVIVGAKMWRRSVPPADVSAPFTATSASG